MQDSVLRCYDSAYSNTGTFKTGIEFAAPYGDTKTAMWVGNSVAGIRSRRNTFENCYLSDDAAIYHLLTTRLDE